MHSYLNWLSRVHVLLCFSFSHLLTFPQQEMEIFPLWRHPQGSRGYWGEMGVLGWHWHGGVMLTPIMSCPGSGSASLALNQNAPVTWVPEEGKRASQKKRIYSSVKPERYFVGSQKGTSLAWRFSPCQIWGACSNHAAAGAYPKKPKHLRNPPQHEGLGCQMAPAETPCEGVWWLSCDLLKIRAVCPWQ